MTEFTAADRLFMARALQLALGGLYHASPNPMVGCVIVDRRGRVIGQGYHRRCGEGHAEVNAVDSVGDQSLLEGSTVYVTLEPCSHYGKTPPCAKLLVEKRVGRVVAAMVDPNPKVAGRGLGMLRDAGVTVDVGLMNSEANRLNEKFLWAQRTGRVFVTAKWAESADCFMDHERGAGAPAARISTPLSSLEVMKLRATHDAIAVGAGTVVADNPSLTVRGFAGRSPRRVVLDAHGKVAAGSRVFANDGAGVVYFTACRRFDLPGHVDQIVTHPSGADPEWVTAVLRERYGCNSLLVEGGASLLRRFLDAEAVNRVRVERSPMLFGRKGRVASPSAPREPRATELTDGNEIDLYEMEIRNPSPDFKTCSTI